MNMGVIYNATGRYMDGNKLLAYHFVGSDGSQENLDVNQIIYFINNGMIGNMRIQPGMNNKIILRGKGINLNELPVCNVTELRSNKEDKKEELVITKKILNGKKCIGYEVTKIGGSTHNISKSRAIDLILKGNITNAKAEKVVGANGEIEVQIYGTKSDFKSLPVLIVCSNGKIVDPLKNADKSTIRALYTKRAGVIKRDRSNDIIMFSAGDIIICTEDGKLRVANRLDISSKYIKDNNADKAACDFYIDVTSDYCIEIFGGSKLKCTANNMKNWMILKKVN